MKWIDIVTRKQNILLIYTKLYGWCEKMKDVLGIGFNYMLMVSHQEATTYYVYESELTKLLKILKSKILKDKIGKQSLAQIGVKRFQNVIDYLKIITQKNLRKSNDKQLASYFNNYFERQIKSLPFLVLPTFVDDILVEEMQEYLEKVLKNSPNEKAKKISEYINIFTSLEEESYATKAERELLEIALPLLKEKNVVASADIKQFTLSIKQNKAIHKKVFQYNQKWEWLPIQAEEEPYNMDFLIGELQKLVASPVKIKMRLSELDKHIGIIKAKKTQLLKNLKIDRPHHRLIAVFQKWVYLKDFRRSIISQERLYSRSLYAEIGKRLKLTGREVRFLSPNELVNTLSQKSNLPSKEEIYDRMKAFVLLRHNKEIKLLTGEKANKIIRQELPVLKVSEEKILKGTSASPGRATGNVKIILGAQDASKITVGDVLVARQTTPDLLGAMKKSIAIITDEGGLLCHAAIVSRELKLPCIVGIKIATNVLKDGDIVEVNADNGMVTILKK
jgi:phosphoenolpyruvate synthase/pyruvate phosphate dikinase